MQKPKLYKSLLSAIFSADEFAR